MGDFSSKELICEGEIIDPSTNSQIAVITPKSEDIQDQLREHSQPVNDPLLRKFVVILLFIIFMTFITLFIIRSSMFYRSYRPSLTSQ